MSLRTKPQRSRRQRNLLPQKRLPNSQHVMREDPDKQHRRYKRQQIQQDKHSSVHHRATKAPGKWQSRDRGLRAPQVESRVPREALAPDRIHTRVSEQTRQSLTRKRHRRREKTPSDHLRRL